LVRLAIKTMHHKKIHSEGWNGELSRRRLGRDILDLGNLENEAHGIEFGYRYESSPVICHEPHTAAADHIDTYTPSTVPGVRPPSLFLEDGQAIFDLFGHGFTLLRFDDIDVADFAAAAAECEMPLEIVDIREEHARALYQRDLVLIRPDHHVAWRGNAVPDQPKTVIDRVRGAAPGWPARAPQPHLVDLTN
jgi:hypothetical protein